MKETTTFQFYAPEYKDPINVKDITNNFIRLDEILESFTVERKLVTNTFNELKVYPPYYIIRNDNDFDVTIYDRTFEEEYIIKAGGELQKMVNEGVGLRLNMLVQGLHDVELTYYISTEEAISEASGSDYRLASVETTEYAASYKLQVKPKGASDFIDVSGSVPINIPKDKVIKSGDVKTCQTDGVPAGFKKGDKYIDLVIDNDEGSHIYIPVNALVDNTAEGITYSNTTSKLTATNVQTAIDEVLGIANSKQTALTEEQLSAVNSGITAEAVEKYDGYENDIEAIEKTIKGSSDAFVYDSTAKMTKVVPDGVNKGVVSTIGGKTAKMIQMVSGLASDGKISGITITYNDGTVSLSGTATADINTSLTNPISFVSGHKMLIKGCKRITSSNRGSICISAQVMGSVMFYREDTIITPIATVESYLRLVLYKDDVATPSSDSFTPMVFDLTAMFGAGKEPTIEQFNAMFGTGFIPYTAGELWNAPVKKVVLTDTNENKTTLLLDKIVDKLPDYGASVNDNLYNYVDFEEMVYHHKVIVKKGSDISGSWTRTAEYNYYSIPAPSDCKRVSSASDVANIICDIYTTTSNANYNGRIDKSISVSGGGNLGVVDSGNVTDVTETLKNMVIYYELAKEELIPLTDLLLPFKCEPGGTVTFENEHNLDVPNSIIYEKEMK